jgi:erythromycin esterase-like protein
MSDRTLIDTLRREAEPLPRDGNHRNLLDQIGDAQVVLLGEATHGTREFYRTRAEISRQLIVEKDFDAIAVEADWPDALRASRYAAARMQGDDRDASAADALRGFERFPQWMWRNTEVVELMEWLRGFNAGRSPANRVGFFGLDLYSLRSSMQAVVRYLSQHDPEAAQRARARYSCFDHLAEDPQRYGYATTFGIRQDCEEEVVRQLQEMTAENYRTVAEANADTDAIDEWFYALQNARVARNAESYYRAMFLGRDESWNLRDTHMAETLDALREHLGERRGRPSKVIVWAHNSHIGDARATEMGDHGQLNLGQLARQRIGADRVFLLGFTTHDGTVTAASDWNAPSERKTVRPSRSDSYEWLFHQTGLGRFLLPLRRPALAGPLHDRRLERAIGVIYLPDTERLSHYFHADIAAQFDAVIHLDHTAALQPLDTSPHWQPEEEVPETYPSGI